MSATKQSRLSRAAPALTLLILSPVMVEVLFGSTHLTIISALIPETGFYGGAALIIRYLVRRQRRGWLSLLLLGVAFALFEELLVIQTSASATLFVGSGSSVTYGLAFGVHWVYLLWAAGYESVWGIVLPVYLTELVFPDRRKGLWLGGRGLSVAVVLFVLGSLLSWYIWTQVVAPAAIGYVYSPPLSMVAFALAAIGALGVAALGPRPAPRPARKDDGKAPRPSLVGALTFALGLLWFFLLAFQFEVFPAVPAAVALAAGLVLAGASLFAFNRLSNSVDLGDGHRLATVVGGLAASMLAGFWASGIVLAVDFAGKIAFDAIAVVMLLYLARALRRRAAKPPGLEDLSPGAAG